MKDTSEQVDILTLIPPSSGSWIIDAKAGSGKTHTCVKLAPLLPNARFLAFNKAIATELTQRLPSSCPASTFHSLGFAILRDRFGKVKMNSHKTSDIVKKLQIGNERAIASLVGQAKTAGIGLIHDIINFSAWDDLIDLHNIDVPENMKRETFISHAIKVLNISNEAFRSIDFDDMIYLPLIAAQRWKWSLKDYPLLIVDEAQDVSPLRLEFLKALTDRIIAVGDPYQAIYGFTGAIDGALPAIARHFNAKSLPLSISFRCSTAILDEANEILGEELIFPKDGALQGEVLTMKADDFLDTLPEEKTNMILCRTNMPLFLLAMRYLRSRTAFRMMSDLPLQLIKFVKSLKGDNLTQLQVRLRAKWDTEAARLERKRLKGPLRALNDKCETLMALIKEHIAAGQDLPELMNTLDILLKPGFNGPLLSTIHKSKGLESQDVFILRPDLIPAPWASEGWELSQETNIHYVAVTRAISTLTYVEGEI